MRRHAMAPTLPRLGRAEEASGDGARSRRGGTNTMNGAINGGVKISLVYRMLRCRLLLIGIDVER